MSQLTVRQYQAQERLLAAREGRRGLRIHAMVTVAVVLALALVNVFVVPQFPWSVFPAFGMGLGVWFHWYFGVNRGDELVARHQEEVERVAERATE